MSEYTVEHLIRVWDDARGAHIDVCEDGDALGLVEVRSVTPEGKIEARMTFDRKQAELVATAMLDYLKHNQSR
jgi:hypothetical protein